MVAIIKLIKKKNGNLYINFNRFVSHIFFDDIKKVEINIDRDEREKFMTIRPLKEISSDKKDQDSQEDLVKIERDQKPPMFKEVPEKILIEFKEIMTY